MIQKSRIYKTIPPWLILLSSVCLLTSCGCPDYEDYGEELLVLTAEIDGNNDWNEQLREEPYTVHDLREALINAEEETYISGNKILVANQLFDYKTGLEISLPDSLKECTFGKDEFTMICAVAKQDSLYNAYLDTTLYIKNAKSKLYKIDAGFENRAFQVVDKTVLANSTAEFTSDNRYTISTYHNPVYDDETTQIYVQKSTEIREFVRDSSGSIVNDILFHREFEQLAKMDSEFASLITYGPINTNERFPEFAVSSANQKYAFSYRGNIYVQNFNDEEPEIIRPGLRPLFLDSGTKLSYLTKEELVEVYDIESKNHFFISGQSNVKSLVIPSEDSQILYYLSKNGVHRFNASTNEGKSIIDFSDYIEERQKENEDINIQISPVQLFFSANSPKTITLLAFSDYSIFIPCK